MSQCDNDNARPQPDHTTLAQIQRDLRDLKAENARLREHLAALETRQGTSSVPVPPTPSVMASPLPRAAHAQSGPDEVDQVQEAVPPGETRRTSRRGILRAVVGVAAAAAGAGALGEAAASDAPADHYGSFSTHTQTTPAVRVRSSGGGTYGVQAVTDVGFAVYAQATSGSGYGIYALGGQAVFASGSANTASVHTAANGVTPSSVPGTSALFAEGGNAVAIYATSSGGPAVNATNSSSGVAISATSSGGSAVNATSSGGPAVNATSSSGEALFAQGGFSAASIHAAANGVTPSSAPGTSALFAEGDNAVAIYASSLLGGTAIIATSKLGGDGVNGTSDTGSGVSGHTTDGSGLYAVASGTGTGVTAYGNTGNGVYGSSYSGTGVYGTSTQGYGLAANGGLAPLYLTPAGTAGHPTSGAHSAGELYVDSNGVLYFCVAGGTPGTWKTVTLA